METAVLQGLFVKPREGADPRVAKTDTTVNSHGSDGILYRMLDEKDWGVFHTLSEREMEDDLRKSREIKENMFTLSGRFKDGHYLNKPSSTSSGKARFVAPQFGTASHARKLDRRKWDAEMSSVLKTDEQPDGMVAVNDDTSNVRIHFATDSGGIGAPQSDVDRANAAVQVMQEKYEQNLHVVERLHEEKQHMSQRMKALEEVVSRMNPDAAGAILGSADDLHAASLGALPPPAVSDFEPQYSVARGQEEALSAMDLAHLLNHNNPNQNGNSSHAAGGYKRTQQMRGSAKSKASYPGYGARGSTRAQQGSQPNHGRPASASRARRSSEAVGTHNAGRRSWSASRSRASGGVGSSRKVSGVSAHLQADADRYIQRRRLFDEEERLKKLEQEQYEQQLRERQLRASMKGKEFTEMLKRQELARQQHEARMDKLRQEELDREARIRQERRSKMEANKQSMTMVTKNQLSWRELQEVEEAKRRDRIEKRKQELTMLSAMPNCIAESMSKPRRFSSATADAGGAAATSSGGEFRAEDPEKVAAKLARQQRAWDMKMEREKENRRERHAAKLLASAALQGDEDAMLGSEVQAGKMLPRNSMEARQLKYAAKREGKLQERTAKQRADEAQLREKERRRMERLMNAKVPEGRPTQAALLKAEKVRHDLRLSASMDQKALSATKRKELAEKEHAAVLKTIISERERERRASHGGYVELNAVQNTAADAAAAAREEYRRKLRSNKEMLQEKMKDRPTLIERHDQRVAVKNAANAALHTVAHAATNKESGRSRDSDDGIDGDDIFDAKEKILLGLQKKP